VRSRGRTHGLSEPKQCSFGKQEFSEWIEGKIDKNCIFDGERQQFPETSPSNPSVERSAQATRQPSNQSAKVKEPTDQTEQQEPSWNEHDFIPTEIVPVSLFKHIQPLNKLAFSCFFYSLFSML